MLCFSVVLVCLGLVSWVQAGREGVNVVLWKTSPQPPGSVLETPGRAACPGNTRGEVCRARVNVPVQSQGVREVKGRWPEDAPSGCPGQGSVTGTLPPLSPPDSSQGHGTSTVGSRDRGSALGFPVLAPGEPGGETHGLCVQSAVGL